MIRILIILLLSGHAIAQSSIENALDMAFQNAKKGMYWALGNIPEKKTQADNDLIDQDKLISSVRLFKEINGLRIESTGYYESTQIKLTIFRSADMLLKEGYLKPDSLVSKAPKADSTKKTVKKRKL